MKSSFQRVYVAYLGNSDLCLSFIRHCVDYGEKVFAWHLASVASTSSHVGAAHGLRERITGLRSNAVGSSAEIVVSARGLSSCRSRHLIPSLTYVGTSVYCSPGSRRFKVAYDKALTLEQKGTSGLNALVEKFSSWIAVTDGPPDDALPDVVTLEQLSEVKSTWEKARDSLRAARAALTDEPAPRMALMHPQSAFKRWVKCLVRFSCILDATPNT